jgi:hypothetical protein
MKKLLSAIFVLVMAFSIFFGGSVISAEAQSMKGTVSATKHKSYRGGRYVYRKTWNGTKWTYRKVKRGTKWTAHKTKRGTKWTAHKTKRGTKHIFHKTKEAIN